MPVPQLRRLAVAFVATALAVAGGTAALPAPAAAAAAPTYTVTVGTTGSYGHPTDTPASPYIDKDGTFYFQQSAALYGTNEPRYWDFFTGTDLDTATRSTAISNAVNPANANDRNNDTTWRCNNSPTGLTSTAAPAGSGYAQKNYCDLSGVWVDPDTGDWYGLVHNEFTPQPFGDGLHFDAIDYAVSKDQGRTWTIKDKVITSPYSTTRNDTAAFPNKTYYYGDGDQRLLVDTASGYFYVFYGSRLVDKSGGWKAFHEHVARAPIAGKMAPGTWQKWYDGAWSQPGAGGKESNLVPVTGAGDTGYTPAASEYSPAGTGTVSEQVAAGKAPATSPLFVMDVTWNAYLGLYIGEPQQVDQSGNAPRQFYATADLATQKWTLIGDTGSYHDASWYRWFLDGANRTSSSIVGKTFRAYCSISCASSSGEYANITIDSPTPAAAPFDPAKTYKIASGSGRVLAQTSGATTTTSLAAGTGSALEAWSFASNGDGSYRIGNSSTGQLLGVDSSAASGRAWTARPTVTAPGTGGPTVGQQWFVIANRSATGVKDGTYRLVNRYSGLVIGLSSDTTRLTETTPARHWPNSTGNSVGGTRAPDDQTLTVTATGTAAETVLVTDPGSRTGTVGTAASVRIVATDSQNKALTFSATGLPGGLSISSAGLITGTPTTAGTSTVTVTASSGTAAGSTTFSWTVDPAGTDLTGTHTVVTGGKALDDPNHSTASGTQLITWTANGGTNQNWRFTRQSDGSYQLVNGLSGLCADVSGGSTAAGAQVIQWTCTGGTNQHWILTRQTGGAFTVASVRSGLLLTTASTSDNAPVTQQVSNGSPTQQWTIR
ncbi:RICIN domain-containing protein [Kitasatospora herbaricolor]|uniref:RICIN domain-containing protein n=1 Tax=Kitasatospora herbaricolor TaxID=68217 RepID=A0ABZ1W1W4_9ACTN|nr:RICIN domain-containing protein [Kitasatospora herbaricolor]